MDKEDKKNNSVFSKTNISVYFTKKKLAAFQENCDRITGRDVEDLKNFADFVEHAVETALDNTEFLQKKLDTANEKIKELENRIIEIQNSETIFDKEIADLSDEIKRKAEALETANKVINDLQKEFENIDDGSQLREDLSTARNDNLNLKKDIQELNVKLDSKIELQDNQVIITMNEFVEGLANKYLQSEKAVKTFEKMNLNGKNNGIYDVINTDDSNKNIANLFTTVFIGSTLGKKIIPIMKVSEIQKIISKFLNNV